MVVFSDEDKIFAFCSMLPSSKDTQRMYQLLARVDPKIIPKIVNCKLFKKFQKMVIPCKVCEEFLNNKGTGTQKLKCPDHCKTDPKNVGVLSVRQGVKYACPAFCAEKPTNGEEETEIQMLAREGCDLLKNICKTYSFPDGHEFDLGGLHDQKDKK